MSTEHAGSRDTYDYISKWANTPFPFSLKDGWGRYGMLGVIGDVVLDSLPGANIVEVGTGESSMYLTQLAIYKQRRIFYCDAAPGKIINPLTVQGYLHPDTVMISDASNEAVIMDSKAIAYAGTSDDFFRDVALPPIGLAFIDGEHHYEYVKRDFENIFRYLVDDGYIFLHDTYPYNEELVLGDYCADSYKMRQELERDPRVDCFTFNRLVACNVGLTMIRKKPQNRVYYHE